MGAIGDWWIAEVEGRQTPGASAPPGLDDAIRSVEAGATPEDAGLSPLDWLAAISFLGLGGPDALGPTLVQQSPPRPALEAVLTEPALARVFPGADRGLRLALSAGLLQVHDFWDASHQAAQGADDLGESRFSAYWHGIAHRREPDAGNALYWFRRVGRHPLFPALGEAARPILQEHGDAALADRLLGPGGWNPSALIDLCVGARPGTPREALARLLQRLEMQLLLDATAANCL